MDDFIPDDDFQPDEPKMQGKIEKPENFLQRAIKNARTMGPLGGTSITAALPMNAQEGGDLARVIGRQVAPGARSEDIGPMQQGPIGLGLNLAGVNKTTGFIPQPETEYGKNLESSGDIAQLAHLGMGGAEFLGPKIKQGFESFNPISTQRKMQEVPGQFSRSRRMLKEMQSADIQPIEQKMQRAKSVKELIAGKMKEKQSFEVPKVDPSKIDEIVYTGKKDISEKIDLVKKEFNSKFEEGFNKLESNMTKGDLDNILTQAINDLGPETVNAPGTPANKLAAFQKRLIPLDADGNPMVNPSDVLDPKEFQAINKSIMDTLKSNVDAKIKYHSNMMNVLPDTIPGLNELKKEYAPKFELLKQVKSELSTGALKQVASGKAGPTRIQTMKDLEGRIKSQAVSKAEEFALQSKSSQKVASELGLKQDEAREVGSKTLAKIDEYLNSLGSERKSIVEAHKQEMLDLKEMFDDLKEQLGKEKIDKYTRLATAATLASLAGFKKIRSVVRERF